MNLSEGSFHLQPIANRNLHFGLAGFVTTIQCRADEPTRPISTETRGRPPVPTHAYRSFWPHPRPDGTILVQSRGNVNCHSPGFLAWGSSGHSCWKWSPRRRWTAPAERSIVAPMGNGPPATPRRAREGSRGRGRSGMGRRRPSSRVIPDTLYPVGRDGVRECISENIMGSVHVGVEDRSVRRTK
jgi:hypothetical protein